MKKIISFMKKETVLTIATLLAVVSAFFVKPDRQYIGYIDFRTLGILFGLMVIMQGFQRTGLFDRIGKSLLQKTGKLWQLILVLVMLCFFFSMLITNDVSLLTFVPFSILVLKKCGQEQAMIPTVILQTVAANLGSMLTPIGNPQNLYLYGLMDCSIPEFMGILLPYTVMTFVLLLLSLLCIRGKGQEISCRMEEGIEIKQSRKCRNLIYGLLFLLALLVVARILPYGVLVTAVFLYTIIFDREALKGADYALLVTFVSFFILIGNLGRISLIREALERFVSGREILTGVLASQVISNVPAAVLLSGFTENYRDLLVGVNLGGLGTLIASMASLISFKLYTKCYKENRGRYLRWFTLVNIIYLFLLLAAALYLYR
ncbi:SLC13 family permease [Suilimivivens sp.]|uniref:SLC13 family permease n=1 Tax=Suilimivivens sp. TaxID=2981669 RepID=UPI00307B30D6